MLRLVRRLLTALSLLALLAVLLLWARAQWVLDYVLRCSATDDLPALRWTTTTVCGLRNAIGIERHMVRWDLFDGPAAEEFRRSILRECGTEHDTRPPRALPDNALGQIALGFRWYADPRSGESPFAAPADARPQGWHNGATRDVRVAIPWWFLTLCSAILPALSLRRRLRTMRHRPGTCPECGYDLRASPTQCPECGRQIDSPAKSSSSNS